MGRHSKASSRGIGYCGSPGCKELKAPDHFLCNSHLESILKIKNGVEGDTVDPRQQLSGFFLKRSNSAGRHVSLSSGEIVKAPKRPTCCAFGCYEERIPPSSYCHEHLDLGE